MNKLSTLRILFVLLLLVPILTGSKCLSSSADADADAKHDSRIYVVLRGPFADGESAEATVDGQSIGTVKSGASQYIRVDPGMHTISVTTATIPTTFKSTVDIKQNQYFTLNVECDYATVTLKAEGLYALENTKLTVFIDGLNNGVILPGQPLTLSKVAPGKDRIFIFQDDTKKLRYSTTMTIQYKSTNSIEIPYN